jgi:SAM-dependent methyltransferase
MNQDKIFLTNEGNNWYHRNKNALDKAGKIDWPLYLLHSIDGVANIGTVIELGCSTGYRLDKIRSTLAPGCRCVGLDASKEAIDAGRTQYPELELYHGLLSDIPLEQEFDLVIVNFVLHWVDRKTLVKTISEIDRIIKDDGLLILGDFLPDYPQRRRYHHLPDERVFTYKQDYAKIFEQFGTYRELVRFTFDHDNVSNYNLGPTDSSARGVCSILHKSIEGYYPEVNQR